MNDLLGSDISCETSIEASGISKVYWDGSRRLDVLTDVSFSVRPGEAVAIVGPSGSGKTTLLNILSGLDEPSAGQVRIGGVGIHGLGEDAKAAFRNENIGFVFQFYHLLAEFTALENVMLPVLIRNHAAPDGAARRRAETLLSRVGLAERAVHFPGELSGGEQQRVAIARALVNGPKILFCDEPTGNLDPRMADEIVGIIRDFFYEDGRCAVIVTHDEKIAGMADRVLRMEELNRG